MNNMIGKLADSIEVHIVTTKDGSHSLYLPHLSEQYHSIHGAIQEAEHVFIQAGLADSKKKKIHILETGFGTGLNALLTWIYAEQHQIEVHYQTIEKYPLSADIIAQLNYEQQIGNEAIQKWNQLHECEWNKQHVLSPYFTMVKQTSDLTTMDFPRSTIIDLIYFDAFAPDKQPEMWTAAVFSDLFNVLAPSGIFVTYCAKGSVKRTLKAVGFEVTAIQGPPGKREMIRAYKS